MTMTYYTYMDSPVEQVLLTSDGDSLTGLYMDAQKHGPETVEGWIRDDDAEPFSEAKQQLAAYFEGRLSEFSLPLGLHGTEFQRRVWGMS